MAALPGIVGKSVGLPDIHSGYGFAIGNMAAFDCGDPKAVVSPGPATHRINYFLFGFGKKKSFRRADLYYSSSRGLGSFFIYSFKQRPSKNL